MIEIEEEVIMIENKKFIFVFSIEFPHKVFVDAYNKDNGSYLCKDYEIKGDTNHLRKVIRKEPGSVYKVGSSRGQVKYLVRNRDMCIWSSKSDRIPCTSIDSVYDTRNNQNSITSLLKEVWLRI